MASFTVKVAPGNDKVTVNVAPSLMARLKSYDLNPWVNVNVESFKMNSEPIVAPAEVTPATGDL